MALKSPVGTCLICKHKISSDVNIFRKRTYITKTLLSSKLSRILQCPVSPARNVSQEICRDCFSLMNQLDDCECRLMALENEVKLKCRIPFSIDVQNRQPGELPPFGETPEEPAYWSDTPGSPEQREPATQHSVQAAAAGGGPADSSAEDRLAEWLSAEEREDESGSDVSIPPSDYGMSPARERPEEAELETAAPEPPSEPQPAPAAGPEQPVQDALWIELQRQLEPELPQPQPQPELKTELETELKPGQEQEPVLEPVLELELQLEPEPGQGQQGAGATRERRRPGRPRKGEYQKPDPFRCEVCDQRFYSKNKFTRHQKLHPDHAVLRCEVCARIFVTEASRKKHMRQDHAVKRRRGPGVTTKLYRRIEAERKRPLSLQEKTDIRAAARERARLAEEAALAEVAAGSSVKDAADKHGVKRTTLQDRVKGRYKPGVLLGRKRSVTDAVEGRIATWLLSWGPVGGKIRSGRLRSAIRSYLIEAAEPNAFKDSMPNERWLRSFLHRFPDVAQHITRRSQQPLPTSES